MVHRLGHLHYALTLLLVAACGDDGASMDADTDADTSEEPEALEPRVQILDSSELDPIDAGLRIVDVRSTAEYEAEHLPGAVHLEPARLRATVDDVAGQVAPPADVEAAFEEAGLAPNDDVLVYGPGNTTDVARVAWTLAYHGHTGRVWMLDGGIDAWVEGGGATESGPVGEAEASRYDSALDSRLRVDADWILEHLDDSTVHLYDARAPDEFFAGHIPGAINVNWSTTVGDDGRFLGEAQLRELHDSPAQGDTLVAYCQTGSRASVTWLVLTSLGYTDVRLYDGSWTEWGADPDLPREP